MLAAALLLTGCGGEEDTAVEEPTDPQALVTVGVAMAAPGLVAGVDPTHVTGAEVELARALIDRMDTTPPDAELRWVPTTAATLDQEVTDEELDLALGQFTDPDASDDIAWVGPYANVEAGLLVHQAPSQDETEPVEVLRPTTMATLEDLAEASVCVVAGSLPAMAELPVDATVEEPTVTECEIGMRSGRYDAIAADDLQLAGLLTEQAMAERYELLLWSDIADDEASEEAIDDELLDTGQYWIGVSPAKCADAAAALESVITDGVLDDLFSAVESSGGYEPKPVAGTDVSTQYCNSDA